MAVCEGPAEPDLPEGHGVRVSSLCGTGGAALPGGAASDGWGGYPGSVNPAAGGEIVVTPTAVTSYRKGRVFEILSCFPHVLAQESPGVSY